MNDSPATSGDSFQASFFVNTPPSSNHDVTIPKKEKDVTPTTNVTDASEPKKAVKRKYTNAELNEIEDKEVRKKLRNRQSALAAR